MRIFFNKKTEGFYFEEINDEIPDGSVEISQDDYLNLIKGQEEGLIILANKKGYPVLAKNAPSDFHKWDGNSWVLSKNKQNELLETQRQQAREAINALRDKKINGGIYVPAIDKWIDTDAVAERNILSVKATFDLFGDQEIPWTFADNSVAMINKEKLLAIWAVLMEAKTGNHANAMRHKSAVDLAENPLDYDFSEGWTTSYEDHIGAAQNEK